MSRLSCKFVKSANDNEALTHSACDPIVFIRDSRMPHVTVTTNIIQKVGLKQKNISPETRWQIVR